MGQGGTNHRLAQRLLLVGHSIGKNGLKCSHILGDLPFSEGAGDAV